MNVFLLPAATVAAVTAIGVACGLVGWFAVLRAQVFAVDAMSHFAFTGAVVAVVLAADPRTGLFGFTLACALLLAALGGRARVDDVTVGVAITWVLGVGVLGLAVIARSGGGGAGSTAAATLFGNISGIDAGQARLASLVAGAVVVVVLAVARPLLFASLDPVVARILGVPAAALELGFLVVLGAVAAEATQAVGALLLIGLVSAPAGAAHRLTARPYHGMALAAGIAVASVWAGLWISARVPALAPSGAIVAVAAAVFAAAAPGGMRTARRRAG